MAGKKPTEEKVQLGFLEEFTTEMDVPQEVPVDAPDPNAKRRMIHGYPFDVVTSAFQKEIRKGDVELAVRWGLMLFNSSPYYAWKRLIVCACEDIGMAAPEVVSQVMTLALGWRIAKEKSWYASPHALTMAIVLLCNSPKSTLVEDLQTLTLEKIRRGLDLPEILPEYTDAHTKEGKEAGQGFDVWYANRIKFGMPINPYVMQIWEIEPKWRPPDAALIEAALPNMEDAF